ncbi:histone deacetylase complex subunit SAP25 isoform X2 [Gracilinanus agilis]|uniref:histone deacetylase complex subunit SAP25 isoform X2 n=1 Tax=Gracilinanus agilis TaxID=191870 RepID=UPI001CFD7FD4|nr:histone deacetylase complex subunit SAP25 isoform X2 [Gracilinanus agilis]
MDKRTMALEKRGQGMSPNQIAQLPTQSLKEKSQPAPWEPDYKKETAGNCGPGTSVSYRTIWHPSFYALYDAQCRDPQTLVPPEIEGNQDSSQWDEGFPALGSEDFFFSDPLLPSSARIPLSLSQPPQQVLRRSGRLLTPPPIMSVWPQPILTWQSGPEITAITSLLEMSQGGTESAPPTSKAS